MNTPDIKGSGSDRDTPPEREITVRNVIIAMACMIGLSFGLMLFASTLGFTMLPMLEEFGWTRAEYSLAVTVMTWSAALCGPFLGRFIDRTGVKPMAMAGTVLAAASAFALSRQTANIWTFYATFALIGLCVPTAIGYTKIIASLFKRNRGKMLAVFGVESAIAHGLTPLIMSEVTTEYGWRMLYVGLGVALLCLLPMILFLIREPGTAARDESVSRTPQRMEGLTISQILKTQPFWIMMIVSVIVSGPMVGIGVHIIPFLVQKGFPMNEAALFMSATYAVGFLGAIYAGLVLDKFGTAKVAAPSYFVVGLCMMGLIVVSPTFGGVAMLVVVAGLGGFGATSTGPMNTYFHTRFFGLRAFTEVHAVERSVMAVATGLAPFLIGVVYDRTGRYEPVFMLVSVTGIVAAGLYLIIGRYRYSADIGLAKAPQQEQDAPPRGSTTIPAPAE